MRQLCSLGAEIQAQQFAAYLFTLGIAATVDTEASPGDPETTQWTIWILEEDDLAQAGEHLDLFLEHPDDPRYEEAVRQASRLIKEESLQREQAKKQQVSMQSQWRRQSPSGRRPLTMTLLIACVVVSVFSKAGEERGGITMRALQFIDHPATLSRSRIQVRDAVPPGAEAEQTLFQIDLLLNHRARMFADPARERSRQRERIDVLSKTLAQGGVSQQAADRVSMELVKAEVGQPLDRYYELKRGQVWRLVTPIFIHIGYMHLLFNMLWLFQLGTILESRYRSVNFGWLVLFTGIAGVLAQSCMPYQWDGGVLGGGFSGVVFGLLGFAWVKTRHDPNSGLVLRSDVFVFMMIFLVLGFTGILDSLVGGSIANWAHAGGLVAGVLAGFASIHRR